MERDELRRGVPRPCLEIGAAGFVVRPDGRGTGTGGLGRVVGGKEAIVCVSLILGDFLFEPQIEFSLECITPL